jgi:hypothetical protein
MHVGELSARSLRRALEASGFAPVRVSHGEMVYTAFVPDERARVTYYRLAARRLTRALGIADLWAIARRPPASVAGVGLPAEVAVREDSG